MGFYLFSCLISAVADMETRGRDLPLAAEAGPGAGLWLVPLRGRHWQAPGHSHPRGMHRLRGDLDANCFWPWTPTIDLPVSWGNPSKGIDASSPSFQTTFMAKIKTMCFPSCQQMNKPTEVTLISVPTYKVVLRYVNYDPIHLQNLLNKMIEFLASIFTQ